MNNTEALNRPRGISDHDWLLLKKELESALPFADIYVFGSRSPKSSRKPSATSDLDLLLVARDRIPPHEINAVSESLSALPLPFFVDLVDDKVLSEKFRPGVESEKDLCMKRKAPRVFISYSQKDYPGPVRRLADSLRDLGFFTVIDQYDRNHPLTWPKWMSLQSDCADSILVVSGKNYKRSYDSLGPDTAGKGAHLEANILSLELYDQAGINDRFYSVLFNLEDNEFIIDPLRHMTYFTVNSDDLSSLDGLSDALRSRKPCFPPITFPDDRATEKHESSENYNHEQSHQVNPNDAWNPMPPERCFGRTKLTNEIIDQLSRGTSINLVGLRRMGKTTLLSKIQQQLELAYKTVVSLSGEKTEATDFQALTAAITKLPAETDLNTCIAQIETWVEATERPVIIFDEFEAYLKKPEHFPNELFIRWRGMMGKVTFVFTTGRPIHEIYKDLGETSPFDNRLETKFVGLTEADGQEKILALGPAKDGETIKKLGGHCAYLIQLLCFYEYSGKEYIDDEAMTQAEKNFERWWQVLSPNEKNNLLYISRGMAPSSSLRTLRNWGLVDSHNNISSALLTRWLLETTPDV